PGRRPPCGRSTPEGPGRSPGPARRPRSRRPWPSSRPGSPGGRSPPPTGAGCPNCRPGCSDGRTRGTEMSGGTVAEPPDPTDVVVVGGGIGGLSMALALRRTGLRVRVLEQADVFGEVGAGLQLAPNATRILREWGLLDEVVRLVVLPRRLVLRDALDGVELTSLDLGHAAARYGAPYVVIHRSDLHRTLLRACETAGVELLTRCR